MERTERTRKPAEVERKPSKRAAAASANVDRPLRAIILISGTVLPDVDTVCNQIKSTIVKAGVYLRGPEPLESKIHKIHNHGADADSGAREYKVIRTYRRRIRVDADPHVMKQIMMLNIPDGVNIELKFDQ